MPASDSATATLTLAGKPAMASRALPANTRSGAFSPSTDRPRATSSGAPARPAGGLRVTMVAEAILPSAAARTASRPEQRARRHDDARAGLAGQLDEVHVIDQRAHRQRHEDAPARDGRLGDLGEMLRRQALDDHVGRLGQRRQVDEVGLASGTPPARRCALSRSRTATADERQARHVARIDAPRHGKPDRAESGDRQLQVLGSKPSQLHPFARHTHAPASAHTSAGSAQLPNGAIASAEFRWLVWRQ